MTDSAFKDRAAIVTGAAQGMGLAIAVALASRGASVVIADVNSQKARAEARNLRKMGLDVTSQRVDVARPSDVKRMADEAARRHGNISILVNNAGVLRPTAASEIPPAEWNWLLAVNLSGPFYCSTAVYPQMRDAGGGRIVNISSLAGRATSTFGGAHYTAAKAGLLGLSRHLAREWAKDGINVNAVCPGIVDTDMVRAGIDNNRLEVVRAAIPFGRLARPSEIAALVCFLASDDAAYITGAAVDIHGGELIIQ